MARSIAEVSGVDSCDRHRNDGDCRDLSDKILFSDIEGMATLLISYLSRPIIA